MHALPFLIDDVNKALALAYVVVTIELMAIALIGKRASSRSPWRNR